MPGHFTAVSEDEQKFGALIERIVTDENFAQALRDKPAQTLEEVGFKLTTGDREALEKARLHPIEREPDDMNDW